MPLDGLKKGKFSFSQETIKQDFELLTVALDASISGIIITDNQQPDNPIIYCNKAFENITGYKRKEIIGHNCRFLQKDDREQSVKQVLREAVEKGEMCIVEIRNYKKDGTLFWNELYMSPVKNAEGVVTYFIGVQNDISRRKAAEQEVKHNQAQMEQRIQERTKDLKESQEYLSSIVQTVRESLIVLSPDLKVLSVNDHFVRTFKVTREETEGELLYALGNGQWDIPELKHLLEQVLPTNNPVIDFEVQHDFPHIGKKLMLVNAYRIELEGSFKDRILIAIEDITDRRAIEQRKDDFLSIASHELKTPLTTIKGYIQIINRILPQTADEKLKNAVGKTSLYVDRLNSLIGELLDVSRIQSGNIELHSEPFDFDEMLREAVDSIQRATQGHEIKVSGSTGCTFNGDESHITQVVTNLLSNAIKYSPDRKSVDVHVAQVSDFIKVSVTDHGVGIPPEDRDKVFERFYRVGNIQQRFPGMGIGLYVCSEIIKNHGGTLWVESELGKGSTFNFTLPLNKHEGGHDGE
ncbi:PAS domain-containing protein [Mucilaginibacter daejeonensis]|uniref:PAS domain-containing sensor histidine kinase n=1 Tax=Mucilaginibacter daejeonensis TaxID=398049 RepID=UPI001D17C589|nr:PAS domain-containing sensor histidine kinase [Mucilaginibacter daejeonensis]UEG54779.1 PAS domain-containing protein [Mucilaginibacter daejeonensis]